MMLITSQNKNPHNTEGKNRKYIKRFKKVKRKYIKSKKRKKIYNLFFFLPYFTIKTKNQKIKTENPEEERTN